MSFSFITDQIHKKKRIQATIVWLPCLPAIYIVIFKCFPDFTFLCNVISGRDREHTEKGLPAFNQTTPSSYSSKENREIPLYLFNSLTAFEAALLIASAADFLASVAFSSAAF